MLEKPFTIRGSEVYEVCNLGLEGIRAGSEVAGNTPMADESGFTAIGLLIMTDMHHRMLGKISVGSVEV